MGDEVAGHYPQHHRTAEIGRNVLQSISTPPAETGPHRTATGLHPGGL